MGLINGKRKPAGDPQYRSFSG